MAVQGAERTGCPQANRVEFIATVDDVTSHGPRRLIGSVQALADRFFGPSRESRAREAVRNDRLLRLHHAPTNTQFIVDLTAGELYGAAASTARMDSSSKLPGEPKGVTRAEIFAAAEALEDGKTIPWPGTPSPASPAFTSGWRLSAEEVHRLKNPQFDQDGKGVATRLTDLQIHTLTFNVMGQDVERMRIADNYRGWMANPAAGRFFPALKQAVLSTGVFAGSLGNRLRGVVPLGTEEAVRLDGSSRLWGASSQIFGADGMLNRDLLQTHYSALLKLASGDNEGRISEESFMAYMDAESQVGRVSKGQWDSMFKTTEALRGSRTISPQDFLDLYSGKLMFEAYEHSASPEDLARLRQNRPNEKIE